MAALKFCKRFILFSFLAGLSLFVLIVLYLEQDLPDVEVLRDVHLQVPLKIYSADGKLIGEYGDKRRTPISINQVPDNLINAIISTEDRRFFNHPGVDLRGMLRAVSFLLTKGTKEQGGSTITMQVARNFFLTRKKTYIRKVNEILLALKIEQELSKEEILELYVNKIYLGKRAYGVQSAAEVYYGTTVDKLTLAQMAMIAGLPQAPSAINPVNSPHNAIKRRNHVLKRMLHYGFINQEDFDEASIAPITAKYHERKIEVHAPYIAEMVRQELLASFGESAYDQGLEIITTVDSKLQNSANKALIRGLLEYDKRHSFQQPKVTLSINPKLSAEEELEHWGNQLREFSVVNHLHPAAVTTVEQDRIYALMKDGSYVEVMWKNMQWARLRLHNGQLTPKAKRPADLVKMGDVIYLEQVGKNTWGLSQVPDAEAAIVALQPQDGAIRALVGGFNYDQSPFNRAVQAKRQPGSAFKPFVYGAALENGFTTASIINDAPIVQEDTSTENDWRPQNHNHKFYGPTRLRVGMTKSRNLVSIRLLKSMGIDRAVDYIERCGISRESLPRGLSLALGTNHISPLNLTSAYSVFPNGGFKVKPHLIEKIVDYNGDIIYQATPKVACTGQNCEEIPFEDRANRAISSQNAYLVTSLLQDVIQTGTSTRLKKLGRRDIAGKTGTTNDHYDAWYTGFNKDLVVTTWVGFDEPKSLKEYAVRAALPMWMYFMEDALKGKPESSPPQPPGMVTVKIDPTTGLLANSTQADGIYEIFTEDTVPKKSAPSKNSTTAASLYEDDSAIESLF